MRKNHNLPDTVPVTVHELEASGRHNRFDFGVGVEIGMVLTIKQVQDLVGDSEEKFEPNRVDWKREGEVFLRSGGGGAKELVEVWITANDPIE